MSGRKSKKKGYIGEYTARKFLESLGYEIRWQGEDPKKADIRVISKLHENGIDKWKVNEDWEVKYRAGVPKCIYQWLEEKNADALLVRRVNKKDKRKWPWLIIRKLEQ